MATKSFPALLHERFTLFGRRIKSLLYTTDVAVIRNSNADAIFAVYPFTAQPAITQALLTASEAPVFVGVGGGTTTGKRSVQLAAVSEMQGAAGVVVNSPAPPEMIEQICAVIDIPVIATVVRCDAVAHRQPPQPQPLLLDAEILFLRGELALELPLKVIEEVVPAHGVTLDRHIPAGKRVIHSLIASMDRGAPTCLGGLYPPQG